jgi:hypothetical protein
MEIIDEEVPDWKLRLARNSAVLHVSEVPLLADQNKSPSCGMINANDEAQI